MNKFVQHGMKQGHKIVIAGAGHGLEALSRRLAKAAETAVRSVDTWQAVLEADPGSLLKLHCELEQGFVDGKHNIAVVAADQTIGTNASHALLAEPELRIGDVVVQKTTVLGF